MLVRVLTTCALLAPGAALAQDAPLITPPPAAGTYDPQLTAKQAVLANWDLAISGMDAAEYVAAKIVDMADGRYKSGAVAFRAEEAIETMVTRYNAAHWMISGLDSVDPLTPDVMARAVRIADDSCESGDAAACDADRIEIRAAFDVLAGALAESSDAAEAEATAREDDAELALLSELLIVMADYLESGDWGTDLALSAQDMAHEEVAARLVGILSIWRNVEPYVGMRSAEIDDAINAAKDELLRGVRVVNRGSADLEPGSETMTTLAASADKVAAELRRAAGLFAG